MKERLLRRGRVVELTVRQQDWALEDARAELADCQRTLSEAEAVLAEVEGDIAALENRLRESLGGDAPLSMSALQDANRYWESRLRERELCLANRRDAEERVETAHAQLRDLIQCRRAWVEIGERTDRALADIERQREFALAGELWLLRRRESPHE